MARLAALEPGQLAPHRQGPGHVPTFALTESERSALHAESKRLRKAAERNLFATFSSTAFQRPPFVAPAHAPAADVGRSVKQDDASGISAWRQHSQHCAEAAPSAHSHAGASTLLRSWAPSAGNDVAASAERGQQQLHQHQHSSAVRRLDLSPAAKLAGSAGAQSTSHRLLTQAGGNNGSSSHRGAARYHGSAALAQEDSSVAQSPAKQGSRVPPAAAQQSDATIISSTAYSNGDLEARLQQIQRHLAEVC